MILLHYYLLKILGLIKLFNFLIKNYIISISYIKYNENIGFETLYIEYKKFTLNLYGLPFEHKELEEYCNTNTLIPNFNNYIIKNLNMYINTYLIKNICGFLNSNIEGHFYIGIDDFGNIKGIPYLGLFPLYYIYVYIYIIIYWCVNSNEYISSIYNKITIKFIKVEFCKNINNKIHPQIYKYNEKK